MKRAIVPKTLKTRSTVSDKSPMSSMLFKDFNGTPSL